MKLPQLSLRELFLLVALVAMGCGWWVNNESWKRRERLAKETLSKATNKEVHELDWVWQGKIPEPSDTGASGDKTADEVREEAREEARKARE